MDKNNKNPFFDFFKQKVESELKKSFEGMEDFEDLGRRITNLMTRKKKQWQDYQAENNPPGKNEESDKTAEDTIIIEVKDGSSKDASSETENNKEATKEEGSANKAPKSAKKENSKSNKKAKSAVNIAVKNAKKSFKEKAKKAAEKKNKGAVNSPEIERLNQEFQMELDLQDGRYRITLEQLEKANKLAIKAMKKAHKKRIKALREWKILKT